MKFLTLVYAGVILIARRAYVKRKWFSTTVSKLSSNIEELVYFIENTPVLLSGNSTDDEAVEDALHDAINISWREIGSRSVVLFGDA